MAQAPALHSSKPTRPIKPYLKSLFLFRRDLRIDDNTGLNEALSQSKEVVPAFALDPRQTEPHDYRSEPGLWFLRDALESLHQELESKDSALFLFSGKPHELVDAWVKKLGIEAIWVNRDYTPFSLKRDHALESACKKQGIAFHSCSDLLLNEPEEALKADGKPYTVFTPYFNRARSIKVSPTRSRPSGKGTFAKSNSAPKPGKLLQALTIDLPEFPDVSGGRSEAKKALRRLSQLSDYADTRDLPALKSTSHLSVHLKFGTCSVREAYHAIRKKLNPEHPLIRQLYWRDFLTQIAFHFPSVFGNAFKDKYNRVAWKKDQKTFSKWTEGLTGFPLVDAGMRQLNQTGFMHNRVRMVVASFLTKDLHIDWRWGERYFAQRLVDYDPCVNNGNWQWAASTGCDAQPYFRIFNPWRQQGRFDPDCEYIKKWIPELESLSPRQIHRWEGELGIDYPAPMLEHKGAAMKAKMLFDTLS